VSQCHAKAKATGEQCRRSAQAGGVCYVHGGNAPQTLVAQKRRDIHQEALAVVTAEYGEGFAEMEDPAGELLSLASEYVAIKGVLASRAAELEHVSHENRAGDQTIQATLQAYLQSLDHVADVLVKINRLGLAGHGRAIREEDAQRVHLALMTALQSPDADLSHEQILQVRAAFAVEIQRAYAVAA
jgi:hypothetical protein